MWDHIGHNHTFSGATVAFTMVIGVVEALLWEQLLRTRAGAGWTDGAVLRLAKVAFCGRGAAQKEEGEDEVG